MHRNIIFKRETISFRLILYKALKSKMLVWKIIIINNNISCTQLYFVSSKITFSNSNYNIYSTHHIDLIMIFSSTSLPALWFTLPMKCE